MRLSISRPSERALRRVSVPNRPRIVSGLASAGSVGPSTTRSRAAAHGPVAEGDHDRVSEVDAAQLGGHIHPEVSRQRNDVGVMGEHLLFCRVKDAFRGDAEVLGGHVEHLTDEASGQAVGLE